MTASCRDADAIPKVPRAGLRVVEDGRRVQIMHNGVRVLDGAYCGEWMAVLIERLLGHHEPQEEAVFHQLGGAFREDGTILELGGFWAYYSLWFLLDRPLRSAVLVEPDPGNLEVARRHFELNGRRGVFVPAAIGHQPGVDAAFQCESDGRRRSVRVATVDELVEEHGLERVEVLHADIQGAELAMLHGARRSIEAGRVRFLFLSTHHHVISGDPLTHQRCLAELQREGAVILAQHSVSESFSGDGLIVASFRAEDAALGPFEISRNLAGSSLFREVEYDLAEAWEKIELGRWEPGAGRPKPG